MREKDVIQLIRHDRHDLMNQIQLLQGYATMGKVAHVQQKLDEMIIHYQNERKLLNLDAPNFVVWLLRSSIYNHIRITYVIADHLPQHLHTIDHQLVNRCEQMIGVIKRHGKQTESYEVKLILKHVGKTLEMKWYIDGPLTGMSRFKSMMTNDSKYQWIIDQKADEQLMCKLRIPYE
ncbi:MAG TPA: Spo0B domain-containing protein [Bacillota bacterium]